MWEKHGVSFICDQPLCKCLYWLQNECVTTVYSFIFRCDFQSLKLKFSSNIFTSICLNLCKQVVWLVCIVVILKFLMLFHTSLRFTTSSNLQVRTQLMHIWRQWWLKLLGPLTSQCSSPCLERNWMALTQKTSSATPLPASMRKELVSAISLPNLMNH